MPTSALFQFGHLGAQPGVVGEEPVAGLPVPLDQGVPDEELAGRVRIERRVADPAAGDQRQAE